MQVFEQVVLLNHSLVCRADTDLAMPSVGGGGVLDFRTD